MSDSGIVNRAAGPVGTPPATGRGLHAAQRLPGAPPAAERIPGDPPGAEHPADLRGASLTDGADRLELSAAALAANPPAADRPPASAPACEGPAAGAPPAAKTLLASSAFERGGAPDFERRIAEIRAQIAAGTYLTPAKLEATVEALWRVLATPDSGSDTHQFQQR